jgi:hypothetical protein
VRERERERERGIEKNIILLQKTRHKHRESLENYEHLISGTEMSTRSIKIMFLGSKAAAGA